MRDARRAGICPASNATVASSAIIAAKISGWPARWRRAAKRFRALRRTTPAPPMRDAYQRQPQGLDDDLERTRAALAQSHADAVYGSA